MKDITMAYRLKRTVAKPIHIWLLFAGFSMHSGQAQSGELPYREIPEAPENYTAGAVVSRLIDGLGFRFYWATEGLLEADLAYKPSPEGRTVSQTIDHIHGLCSVILNSALKQPNGVRGPSDKPAMEKRAEILRMLHQASEVFRNTDDLSDFTLVFQRGENTSEYPFWNQINGPISDALWHCGQIVSHRRASGNPFNSKVSVFTGTVRE